MSRSVSLLNATVLAAALVAPAGALAEKAGPRLMENVRKRPSDEHRHAIKVDVNLVLVP
jgi:hypothetical protein